MKEKVLFIDLGAALRKGPAQILVELTNQIEHHEPSFVAIDSYRAIGDLLRSADSARSFAYDLSVLLLGCSATTLLVGEYTRAEVHDISMELAVADGVIELGSRREELTSIREVEIVKNARRVLRNGTTLLRHHERWSCVLSARASR